MGSFFFLLSPSKHQTLSFSPVFLFISVQGLNFEVLKGQRTTPDCISWKKSMLKHMRPSQTFEPHNYHLWRGCFDSVMYVCVCEEREREIVCTVCVTTAHFWVSCGRWGTGWWVIRWHTFKRCGEQDETRLMTIVI
jgi:hypothetical protein